MTADGSSEPLFFTTDEVDAHDRLAVWREVLGRVYLHLEIEPTGEAPLRASLEAHRWAPASLCFSELTPVRAARTAALVQDGDVDFRLVQIEGSAYRYTAAGVDETIPPGGAALLFNGAVSTVSHLGPSRVTAIRISRADLATRVRDLDARPLRSVVPGAPALRLLGDYAGFLRKQGPVADPTLQARVASHLADLVALAIGATRDAAEIAKGRGVRAARLAAIKADVSANIGDARLSAEAIALRHGVTSRYVRMLFESEGINLSAFVLELRLARAHRMLGEQRLAAMIIGAIASDCGFNDLSYFNRSFRRRYGGTPTDVRGQAQRMRG
jgi:AraC-like DNA-binding protein